MHRPRARTRRAPRRRRALAAERRPDGARHVLVRTQQRVGDGPRPRPANASCFFPRSFVPIPRRAPRANDPARRERRRWRGRWSAVTSCNVQRTSATPSSPPSCATHRTLPVSAPTFRSNRGSGFSGRARRRTDPRERYRPPRRETNPSATLSLGRLGHLRNPRVVCRATSGRTDEDTVPISLEAHTSPARAPPVSRKPAGPRARWPRLGRLAGPRGGANAASFPNPEARPASRAHTTSTGAGLRSRTRRLTEPSAARRSARTPAFVSLSLAPTKTRSNDGRERIQTPTRRRDGTASSTGQRSTGNGSFDNGDNEYGS